MPVITSEQKGEFLLSYIDLLLKERVDEAPGFRHAAPGSTAESGAPARGRERWVINKQRALGAWYTKGCEGGSELRSSINTCTSVEQLSDLVRSFFLTVPADMR